MKYVLFAALPGKPIRLPWQGCGTRPQTTVLLDTLQLHRLGVVEDDPQDLIPEYRFIRPEELVKEKKS